MDNQLQKKGGEINFKSRVKSLFPSLKIIDGEVLLDEIKFGLEDESDMPVTVKSGFFDSEITLSTAQAFLLQYLRFLNLDFMDYLTRTENLFLHSMKIRLYSHFPFVTSHSRDKRILPPSTYSSKAGQTQIDP